MSLLTKILPSFSSVSRQILPTTSKVQSVSATSLSEVSPGGFFGMVTRNIIRIHFPRPNETKRIKRHGYKHRMSTAEGRRVLMNRILKGRYVISH